MLIWHPWWTLRILGVVRYGLRIDSIHSQGMLGLMIRSATGSSQIGYKGQVSSKGDNPQGPGLVSPASDTSQYPTVPASQRAKPTQQMDDPFDEFLRQADLAKYKDVFLENEYDSVDLLLALEVSDMKEIGMKPGAIKKLQMAQKQHEQTHTQSAIPTSSQTHTQPPPQSQPNEVVVQEPTRVLTANDYVPAHPLDGWVCQNNFTSHEVFIRWR
ncbi:uncharacterized protein BJ171DRAFT_475751 [Polychytrium aggregatum]|uniref:uncharacterized protein n=1 Tax=Polychytrium aggregatum TaxID=110093 RepID=UPI0022FF04A9|nr:uncharacterized protein BJ171DRAFT_475751 [Polychytrium aggregatum]KAI9203736.1 hypothetical protein BJ171DRAFT_475751 [Polychytrium aggregatum]